MKAICKYCQQEYTTIPYRIKKGQEYCSISCGLRANPRTRNKGNAHILLEYKKSHAVWNKGKKHEAIAGAHTGTGREEKLKIL